MDVMHEESDFTDKDWQTLKRICNERDRNTPLRNVDALLEAAQGLLRKVEVRLDEGWEVTDLSARQAQIIYREIIAINMRIEQQRDRIHGVLREES